MAAKTEMTSMQRIIKALNFQQTDRPPFFLPLSIYGAKELGLSVKEYFAKPENVVEGQLRMLKKYRHDCLYAFYYAALEVEGSGAETLFFEDGPPNSGEPVISHIEKIRYFQPPDIKGKLFRKVLQTISLLKQKVQNEVPVVGVVVSPFSLPIMQLGFDKYIELFYCHREYFNKLIKVNEDYCVQWANAQLKAGADLIAYFDPALSTDIFPLEISGGVGSEVAQRVLSKIKGPSAIHMASGRCLPIIKELARSGARAVGVSALEDLSEIKASLENKIAVLGNLNGLEMCGWTREQTEARVKNALARGGAGGGFVLTDNHGEIPLQVPEEVLLTISEVVRSFGRNPPNQV